MNACMGVCLYLCICGACVRVWLDGCACVGACAGVGLSLWVPFEGECPGVDARLGAYVDSSMDTCEFDGMCVPL